MPTADPATLDPCRCSCGTKLWSLRKGEWCLIQRVLKYDATTGTFVARCPSCRCEVTVPWLTATPPRPEHIRRRVVVRALTGSPE